MGRPHSSNLGLAVSLDLCLLFQAQIQGVHTEVPACPILHGIWCRSDSLAIQVQYRIAPSIMASVLKMTRSDKNTQLAQDFYEMFSIDNSRKDNI